MKELLLAVLSKIRNAEHFQYHYDTLEVLTPEFAQSKGIGNMRQAYADEFAREDEVYMQNRAYESTTVIEGADGKRDVLNDIVKSVIDRNIGHPDESRDEAAHKLAYVIKPYRDAKSKPYAENTALVANMCNDLLQPANEPYMAALGLGPDVLLLKEANEAFNKVWQERSDEKLSRREAGNMKDVRVKVDAAYRTLVNVVYALYQVNESGERDPDVTASFEAVIDRLNAITLQLQQTVARRSGNTVAATITASEKTVE